MASIQDMAKTATSIRATFEGIIGSIGDSSDARAIMCAIGDMYINVLRLDDDLREAAAPSPENNTGGGAAEKMPGGGSGNFDREGGLENPNAPFTPSPHVACVEVAGKIDGLFDYKIEYDDHQFFAAVTVPVKAFFYSERDAVYRDPAQSVAVATTVAPNGDLYCSGKRFRDADKGEVVWDILEQAEKIEDLPEFKQAYGLWQQRAEAFNRAEEAYTKAA